MHGAEYDEMKAVADKYADKIESIKISEPLLGEVGADASAVNEDKKAVAGYVVNAAVADTDYDTLDAAKADGAAIVLMGHGTSHAAKITYSQMQTQMKELGYENVWVGTVEGEPEYTSCENVLKAVHDAGYKKVVLRPLMVVAGDHANNDMAGDDEDSWKSKFIASEFFDKVETEIAGMGRIEEIEQIYVKHLKDVIK